MEAGNADIPVFYQTIENSPLPLEMAEQLNYCAALNVPEYGKQFFDLHRMNWNEMKQVNQHFTFIKKKENFLTEHHTGAFDLIYYDAFDPATQPEMWTADAFRKIYDVMADNAVLLTYCSKTVVRKAMEAVGLLVEKIPGPHGKREIVRAYRRQ